VGQGASKETYLKIRYEISMAHENTSEIHEQNLITILFSKYYFDKSGLNVNKLYYITYRTPLNNSVLFNIIFSSIRNVFYSKHQKKKKKERKESGSFLLLFYLFLKKTGSWTGKEVRGNMIRAVGGNCSQNIFYDRNMYFQLKKRKRKKSNSFLLPDCSGNSLFLFLLLFLVFGFFPFRIMLFWGLLKITKILLRFVPCVLILLRDLIMNGC
jgi:hypothetical protein